MWNFFAKNGDADFVRTMVDRLTKELPPALMSQHHKVLSVNKVTRLLERNANLSKEYQAANGMGYFRRVKLINAYQWALKEAGYQEDFTKIAVESLVISLVKKK